MTTKREAEPVQEAEDEKFAALVARITDESSWSREEVAELIKAGRIVPTLEGFVFLPPPAAPMSATEVSERLRAQARKEGRMAVIRSIYHVHVRGKGPSLLGNAPNFSGGRLDAFDYAKEAAERTGLAIVEMGANAPANFDKPGIYVRPEVFDENRPGEYRCFRTYGSHY
jgi:hypothetical protein